MLGIPNSASYQSSQPHQPHPSTRLLLVAAVDAAALLALFAANDGTGTHSRNVVADVLRVHAGLAERGLDDVRWHCEERGKDVEGAGVVAVECAEEEGGFAIYHASAFHTTL